MVVNESHTAMKIEELQELIKNENYIKFVADNLNADTNALRLKKFPELSFDVKFAILQIDCKNRIKKKLPKIYEDASFLFPNILSTEQCTAQQIAEFHASLLNDSDKVLDMTAGLCIDTFFISQRVQHVTALEINPETATVAKFNMMNHAQNVTVLNQDCIDYVKQNTESFDVIFIDPARRGDNNKRLFGFADCLPNILELIPLISNFGKVLFIKASPMIDISQSIKELDHNVTDIWVLGINNECKELLFKVDLKSSAPISPIVHTINFDNNGVQRLDSDSIASISSTAVIELNKFLYEPNSCIMKSGIFSTISSHYNAYPISKNSHLFISNDFIPDFPGRKFRIIDIIPFKSKDIKNINKKHPQMNVSVRNFKLSAEELKKKLKVNDGGDVYLFGTTDKDNNATLIICHKV